MLNSKGSRKEPIYENKKTKEGLAKRLELLSRYYKETEEIASLVFSDKKLSRIADDVIDALCLAVSGMIGIRNGFKSIPENPMKDNKGITMQMVYSEPE